MLRMGCTAPISCDINKFIILNCIYEFQMASANGGNIGWDEESLFKRNSVLLKEDLIKSSEFN